MFVYIYVHLTSWYHMTSDSSLPVYNNWIILIMRPPKDGFMWPCQIADPTTHTVTEFPILYGRLTFFTRLMAIFWVHHCICMPLILRQVEGWQYSSYCWLEWHSDAYVGKLGRHNCGWEEGLPHIWHQVITSTGVYLLKNGSSGINFSYM